MGTMQLLSAQRLQIDAKRNLVMGTNVYGRDRGQT